MLRKLVISAILLNLILSALIPNSLANDALWWNENWSYMQEIKVPINTSSEGAKYQPIDFRIEFNNPCWAENEKEHSVRVILQDGENFKELESQIYDLNHTDDTHISACSLVFLIPKEATGTEQYFIYYDDDKKQGPNYFDHVNVGESYYNYEPIRGYPFESQYYKIIEDGYTLYAITQEGKFMQMSSSQQVTKLQSKSESVSPKNGEQVASFDFTYWYKNNREFTKLSTSERFVSKEIFVDGNLMVKFGIVSRSSGGEFQSTVIYKYYYCPSEDKRIRVNVGHEVIKYPIPVGDNIDVFYSTFTSGVFRSSSFSDLNFGGIPPYLHVYGEESRVLTYELDPYPESAWEGVLTYDCDLGNRGWVSVDEGETGKAHSLIFGSTNVVKSGTDEIDGIQIEAFESKSLQLPGIDARFAFVYFERNSSEKVPRDIELPKDFVVNYDAEFFTTEKGGYLGVDKEAGFYKSLVRYSPVSDNNVSDGGEEQADKYVLTVVPRLSAPLSLQFMLSALSGKNPYIWAELYRDNELIASGGCSRISIKDGTKIDWKDSSIFRKKSFPNLTPGKYLVKIWIKDSSTENQGKFIGFQVVEIQKKNLKIEIFCKPEGTILVSVNDQHNNGLKDTKVSLLMNNVVIAENLSDTDGTAIIRAPCNAKDKYQLKVIYKGFVVYENSVRLGYLRSILPVKKLVKFDTYDLTIKVRNSQGISPPFDVDMVVTSEEMQELITIPAEKISNGEYIFIALYPANYNLTIRYKSFEVEEKVEIPATASFDVNLYDLRINVKDSWGLTPGCSLDVALYSKDLEKPVVLSAESISNDTYSFSDLYPGKYVLKIRYKSFENEELVNILGENNDIDLDLVFSAKFNVTMNIMDARGNPLIGVKVLMIRDDSECEKTTNEDGEALFSLPPGPYMSKIYSDDRLIAERKVNVTKDKTVSLVTVEEPFLPVVILWLAGAFTVVVGFFAYRKKDPVFLLAGVAIILAVAAVFSPWWTLQGSSSGVETSSKLYLIPAKLVTITSSSDIIAGEIISLDEAIATGLNAIFLATIVVCIIVLMSLFLRWWNKKNCFFVLLIVGATTFICSLAMFFYRISDAVSIGLGSSFGSENLNINVPGEEMYVPISCNWGLGIGFYLYLVSVCIIFTIIILYIRKYYCREQ